MEWILWLSFCGLINYCLGCALHVRESMNDCNFPSRSCEIKTVERVHSLNSWLKTYALRMWCVLLCRTWALFPGVKKRCRFHEGCLVLNMPHNEGVGLGLKRLNLGLHVRCLLYRPYDIMHVAIECFEISDTRIYSDWFWISWNSCHSNFNSVCDPFCFFPYHLIFTNWWSLWRLQSKPKVFFSSSHCSPKLVDLFSNCCSSCGSEEDPSPVLLGWWFEHEMRDAHYKFNIWGISDASFEMTKPGSSWPVWWWWHIDFWFYCNRLYEFVNMLTIVDGPASEAWRTLQVNKNRFILFEVSDASFWGKWN